MMTTEKVEFFSGVLLVSKDPERLVTFYREVLGIPLKDEAHNQLRQHWGCQLGDLHFAIHPVENFQEDTASGVGAVKLALNIFDLEAFVTDLQGKGLELLYPLEDLGWSKMTAIRDPDGNYLEFTELSDSVFGFLEERRKKGADVIQRWRMQRGNA